MRALVLLVALWASVAGAQTPLPDTRVSAKDRERFQLCRAAIFYHLAAPQAESRLPHAVAETLLEQINLIMFETVRSAPAATVAESRHALGFVEQFFISFSQTIVLTRDKFTDVAEREEALIGCMPFIWMITKERIDYLFLWRERAIGAPASSLRVGDQPKQ